MKEITFNISLAAIGYAMFFIWSGDFIGRGGWYGYIPFVIALLSVILTIQAAYEIKDKIANKQRGSSLTTKNGGKE